MAPTKTKLLRSRDESLRHRRSPISILYTCRAPFRSTTLKLVKVTGLEISRIFSFDNIETQKSNCGLENILGVFLLFFLQHCIVLEEFREGIFRSITFELKKVVGRYVGKGASGEF